MNPLVELISEGSPMPFADWVVAARAAGLRPDTWLRLKRGGLLHTFLDGEGNLFIARGAAEVVEA